jgi:hypothetical protein
VCGVKNYCVVRLCVCAAKFDGREIFLSGHGPVSIGITSIKVTVPEVTERMEAVGKGN